MADKEMIEEKIGEALGLEKAAQKAVDQLDSRGLLEPEHMKKLSKMKDEAGEQEQQMEELVQELTDSDGFDSSTIEEKADRNSGESIQNNGNISWRRPRYTRGFRVFMSSRRRRSSTL